MPKNKVNEIDVDEEWLEIEDGNFEEPEDEEELTALPPRLTKEDISYKDLEELDD